LRASPVRSALLLAGVRHPRATPEERGWVGAAQWRGRAAGWRLLASREIAFSRDLGWPPSGDVARGEREGQGSTPGPSSENQVSEFGGQIPLLGSLSPSHVRASANSGRGGEQCGSVAAGSDAGAASAGFRSRAVGGAWAGPHRAQVDASTLRKQPLPQSATNSAARPGLLSDPASGPRASRKGTVRASAVPLRGRGASRLPWTKGPAGRRALISHTRVRRSATDGLAPQPRPAHSPSYNHVCSVLPAPPCRRRVAACSRDCAARGGLGRPVHQPARCGVSR